MRNIQFLQKVKSNGCTGTAVHGQEKLHSSKVSQRYQFFWRHTTPRCARRIKSLKVSWGNTLCYLPTIWPFAHLALFSEPWRYQPSDAVLTPAISPITGRFMEGGNILFLPVQVQMTCPLPPKKVTSANKLGWRTLHSKSIPESGRISQAAVSNTQNLPSDFNYCWV